MLPTSIPSSLPTEPTNTTSVPSTTTTPPDIIAPIVGGAVGGVFIIIVLILIVIFGIGGRIWYQKKTTKGTSILSHMPNYTCNYSQFKH
jgi:hypothetical protein